MPCALTQALTDISPQRLLGMRRGIEKESLRVDAQGRLATTPHPAALGSPLTHPNITTDFAEAQVELVTGVHATPQDCRGELVELHQTSLAAMGEERLWGYSMPCHLPDEAAIRLGQYGPSHIGQTKTIYRRGLANRYGRRMQTISGIHYNWSLPGLSDADYFALIRNVRRQIPLLLLLFGASPAVNACFVEGLEHGLAPVAPGALGLPFATSLRMGRLGYQSDAQAGIGAGYNHLGAYGEAIERALTQPYPPYARIGTVDADGVWQQLTTSLLQIENEFYGVIRPKQPIRRGERPLHALRERGVAYVELRSMDLDPFDPAGISEATMRVLDLFLLRCALNASPPDTPQEIACLARNQLRTAAQGRDPELLLEPTACEAGPWSLHEAAAVWWDGCLPLADRLDHLHGGAFYRDALAGALGRLAHADWLPSARVLADLAARPERALMGFGNAISTQHRAGLLAQALPPERQAHWARLAADSDTHREQIEAAQTGTLANFLHAYLNPAGLHPEHTHGYNTRVNP
ncbi:MAG: glutamate--cysteine ligase [Proteobacteria bacterium]|nr:glutamate--cysteine ligase [Pseudomonadota bacterium]